MNKKYLVLILIIALVAICLGAYHAWSTFYRLPVEVSGKGLTESKKQSLLGNNSTPLQEEFLLAVREGRNDAEARSAAYFITHRFFDNGGNSYEIYKYIEDNPAIHFLKAAEKIYPDAFSKVIKSKDKPINGSSPHLVYLAYLEVLDKNNYGNLAVWSSYSNQAMALVWFYKNKLEDKDENFTKKQVYYEFLIKDLTEKSIAYSKLSDNYIYDIIKLSKLDPDTKDSDIIVGINQHGSALAQYKNLDMNFESKMNRDEIFSFAQSFSKEKVVEFYLFTLKVKIVSKYISGEMTKENTSKDVEDLMSVAPDPKELKDIKYNVWTSMLDGKIKPVSGSKKNIIAEIAKIHPELKNWLLRSDKWIESDFI